MGLFIERKMELRAHGGSIDCKGDGRFGCVLLFSIKQHRWRDGRVAEGARLESVFRGNSNVGSNPTLSAILPCAPFPFDSISTPVIAKEPVNFAPGSTPAFAAGRAVRCEM